MEGTLVLSGVAHK